MSVRFVGVAATAPRCSTVPMHRRRSLCPTRDPGRRQDWFPLPLFQRASATPHAGLAVPTNRFRPPVHCSAVGLPKVWGLRCQGCDRAPRPVQSIGYVRTHTASTCRGFTARWVRSAAPASEQFRRADREAHTAWPKTRRNQRVAYAVAQSVVHGPSRQRSECVWFSRCV